MDLRVPTSTQEATDVRSGCQGKKRHQPAWLTPFCVSTTLECHFRSRYPRTLLVTLRYIFYQAGVDVSTTFSHYIFLLFQGFLVALQYGFANGEVCFLHCHPSFW